MKKNYLLLLLLFFTLLVASCSDDDPTDYIPVEVPVSPVVMDLTAVPHPKLSDYKFFDGPLKDLQPSYKVLPYKPASDLFSDYAYKSRFCLDACKYKGNMEWSR